MTRDELDAMIEITAGFHPKERMNAEDAIRLARLLRAALKVVEAGHALRKYRVEGEVLKAVAAFDSALEKEEAP